MNRILALFFVLLSTAIFGISYMPKDTPMNCLKDCCANACGNGQWDSDGGFCHGQYADTSACISCQKACREGVGKTGTEPYSSNYPVEPPSYPSPSGGNGTGGAACAAPLAMVGLVCGVMMLRKIEK